MSDVVDEACGVDRDPWLCKLVANLTDSTSAANVAEGLSATVSIALILVGAFIVNRLLRWFVRRHIVKVLERRAPVPSARRHMRAQTMARGLASLTTIIVSTIAITLILAVLGISPAALLTSAGLIGVALAFGAQNLLRDLIAGMFMIVEDQLGVGDVVDVGVATGTVEDVSLRTTRLRDVQGVVWHVPNGVVQRVGNMSQSWSRAVLDIPVSPTADLDEAQRIIGAAAHALAQEDEWVDRILDEPEVWGVESFTLDTVTIRLVAKTAPHQQWRVARELRGRIKAALDAAGIQSVPANPPE